ncbi:competence protein ComFC [Enterococcus sp. PF1-24]|uniref:ComF family protein n=1 Tax=unclassified Enterococcus TaxID=2608891 RepID=UPI002476D05E|nr:MULTISPECIES: ComF family protein [unclassified Enterococcus]MDH6364738.1 competence protein ComFC [Enterococcus sp. PFB1-1]MDH6401786.1 competence protein ComFC [Enterococcus sp. PF1-24]
MKCSYCQKTITRSLTLKEIFLPIASIEEELCSACLQQFRFVETSNACVGCQKQLLAGEEKYCQDCLTWQRCYPDYDFHHQALFCYDEAFKNWIHQYKIAGDYRLRTTFNKEVRKSLQPYLKAGYLIAYLPLSEKRYRQRRFNQVLAFLQAANIPTQPLLKRKKHLPAQAEKNRQERLLMPQPFELAALPETLKNQKILLVDDVYTTGRTMFHGASCLLAAQPQILRTFSLAR